MKLKLRHWIVSGLSLSVLVGCATKNFDKIPELGRSDVSQLTCEEIKLEFARLSQYEDSVDHEASTGQVKQILWGGMWSVMADEKLENVARRDIRKRERMLYEERVRKGCT
jgi:hypothetical protein